MYNRLGGVKDTDSKREVQERNYRESMITARMLTKAFRPTCGTGLLLRRLKLPDRTVSTRHNITMAK